jgi:lysozyme family protein
MADFNQAVQKTLVHEGGYVNNPNDRGGPTKYGITQADMPGQDISVITPAQAEDYYHEHYWKELYNEIDDQLIGEKLFDMGVLFGVGTAVKMLQISMAKEINLVSDGTFGPNTLNATNMYGDLNAYKQTLLAHVIGIVTKNPSQAVFLQGWSNRVNS